MVVVVGMRPMREVGEGLPALSAAEEPPPFPRPMPPARPVAVPSFERGEVAVVTLVELGVRMALVELREAKDLS